MRFLRYAVLMFVGLAACLPQAKAQDAGAGTVAFVLKWPAFVAGNPPLLHVDGGGLLQLLIMAPEALQIIQGAAAGQDVKQKAVDLQTLLEQSKGEAADPAIVCAPQITKITDLEEQLSEAKAALTQAQADKAAAEAAAAEAVQKAAAAEAAAADAAAKANAAESANAEAQRVLRTVQGGIGDAVAALKTVADALNPPATVPTN